MTTGTRRKSASSRCSCRRSARAQEACCFVAALGAATCSSASLAEPCASVSPTRASSPTLVLLLTRPDLLELFAICRLRASSVGSHEARRGYRAVRTDARDDLGYAIERASRRRHDSSITASRVRRGRAPKTPIEARRGEGAESSHDGTPHRGPRAAARRLGDVGARHGSPPRLPADGSDLDRRAAAAPRALQPPRPVRHGRARPAALGGTEADRVRRVHLSRRGHAAAPRAHGAAQARRARRRNAHGYASS